MHEDIEQEIKDLAARIIQSKQHIAMLQLLIQGDENRIELLENGPYEE